MYSNLNSINSMSNLSSSIPVYNSNSSSSMPNNSFINSSMRYSSNNMPSYSLNNSSSIPNNSSSMRYSSSNMPIYSSNGNMSSSNDRFGFIGPFILGGITGGLLAPAFYRPYYNNNYYPYPPYYGPYYR